MNPNLEQVNKRQPVITKAFPVLSDGSYPHYATAAMRADTTTMRVPQKLQGWVFCCEQVYKGLRDDGRPHFLRPDVELLKEHTEWKEYAAHIDQLYAIRIKGCTGHSFRQACVRAV